ncbi:MAG: tetratricopeptide repeat protein [Kofleriaceae bacterium]
MTRSIASEEAAIVTDPDDIELRRVYADALQERDDPRGLHIALAFQAEAGDADAATRVRELERIATARLIKRFGDDFIVKLRWRHGFVEHVDIDTRHAPEKLPSLKLRKLLGERELLAVRGLDLRGVWARAQRSIDKTIADVLVIAGTRPLRWLGIGGDKIDGKHVEAILAALPQLTGLGILTSRPDSVLAVIRGSRLRDLEFGTRRRTADVFVPRLLEVLPPELERLVICGCDDSLEPELLAPILERRVLPRLVHFGVLAPEQPTYALCRALVTSTLLPQLRSLGFCATAMWDDDAIEEWTREHAAAFAHLEVFTSDAWPDDDNGHESGRLGLILKAWRRPAEAVPWLEHHLAFSGDDPEHKACWEELGEALCEAGRPGEALAPLDKAVELFDNEVSEDSVYTYRTRVEAFDALERWQDSLAAAEQALAFEPNSWTERMYGRALQHLGRFDDALAAYDRAVVLSDEHDDDTRLELVGLAHTMRGRLFWDRRRIDDAITAFDRAYELGDQLSKRAASWERAKLELQRGDLVRAQHHFELARTAPGACTYEDGEVRFELGDIAGALALWNQVAAADGWETLDPQGYALVALGRPAEALAVVEAARHEHGGARAAALHALGRSDEAIRALDEYAQRPGLADPVCTYRHLAGFLVQGLYHRAAGREQVAAQLLARARPAASDPGKLLVALRRSLRTEGCTLLCGRKAAAVAIAAAVAVGDRDDARARTRILGAAIDKDTPRWLGRRIWEVHAILPLLGGDAALVAKVLRLVERCGSGLALTGALSAR